MHFHLRGCHPLWPAFPDRSINTFLSLVVTTGCHTRFLSTPRNLSTPNSRLTKAPAPSGSYCGPATPNSPFESFGLGCSDFARHYFRNHGCFLFLQVLRWFTSLSSLDHPMYSDERNWCSHQLGFPIRKSPDHRLLASSRGLSQLTTSFFASLRQGIHTHALSSLTIKSISNTKFSSAQRTFRPVRTVFDVILLTRCFPSDGDLLHPPAASYRPPRQTPLPPLGSLQLLVISIARQIFDFQRSDFFRLLRRRRKSAFQHIAGTLTFGFFILLLKLRNRLAVRKYYGGPG